MSLSMHSASVPVFVRMLGNLDAWLEKAPTAVLRVPSVVFDVERNVLINPEHPDFRRIKVAGTEPVRWDERLFTEKPRS